MNIAFPALLILLLILPGLVFNLAFYQTEGVPIRYTSLTGKTFLGSIITLALHSIWLLLFIHVFSCSSNINQILTLISGTEDSNFSSAISAISTREIIKFAFYLISLYLVSYFLGIILRSFIRHFKLEKYGIFRIDSPWYYLFTGYDWEDGTPDGVRIAAVIEIAGTGYLHIGWLDKFYLDSRGNIDRLVLTNAMRREIGNDKKNDDEEANSLSNRFYPIDGNYFVIKYTEVKNLNVQFLKLEPNE